MLDQCLFFSLHMKGVLDWVHPCFAFERNGSGSILLASKVHHASINAKAGRSIYFPVTV